MAEKRALVKTFFEIDARLTSSTDKVDIFTWKFLTYIYSAVRGKVQQNYVLYNEGHGVLHRLQA